MQTKTEILRDEISFLNNQLNEIKCMQNEIMRQIASCKEEAFNSLQQEFDFAKELGL